VKAANSADGKSAVDRSRLFADPATAASKLFAAPPVLPCGSRSQVDAIAPARSRLTGFTSTSMASAWRDLTHTVAGRAKKPDRSRIGLRVMDVDYVPHYPHLPGNRFEFGFRRRSKTGLASRIASSSLCFGN
jgi:hypothetical protein